MRNSHFKHTLIKLFATGFGLGYSPIIPGTAGSLLGLLIFELLVIMQIPYLVIGAMIILLFFAGISICTKAEVIFNRKDPGQIVIDEITGCLVYLYLVPHAFLYVISGFIIFRILDIIKPYPACWVQNQNNGFAVMADDIVAGIYTAILINIFIWIKGYF